LTSTDQSEVLKPQTIQSQIPVQTSGLTMDPGTAMLLIPEKLHAGVDNSDGKMCNLHNYKLLYICLFTPSQNIYNYSLEHLEMCYVDLCCWLCLKFTKELL